jgi:DNA-binding transcriptional MerR regulator
MIENLTIEELAERSGVSIRTIRFYITEGLLPAPQSRGRNAAYTEEALDRLILIQKLKDAHLPLKEIRDQLDSLSPARIHQLASEQDLNLPNQTVTFGEQDQQLTEASSALNYISRVLDARSAYHTPPQSKQLLMGKAVPVMGSPAPQEPEESWRRIEIAPGIELHIRAGLDPQTEKKISQIIEMARILFT